MEDGGQCCGCCGSCGCLPVEISARVQYPFPLWASALLHVDPLSSALHQTHPHHGLIPAAPIP